MINKKTQNREKDGVNPIVAGVTGAVIGAVAGAAVVLNDKKNREKVKEVLSNVKNQVVGYVEDMQKQALDKKSEVEEKLAESEKTVKKTAKPAYDSLHK